MSKTDTRPRRPRNDETRFEGVRGFYGQLGFQTVRAAQRDGMYFAAGSGDLHLQYHRTKLVNQSRYFMRNNPIYTGMIRRAVSYIVGGGFKLQVNSGDTAANSNIERDWKKYWRKPEARQMLSGKSVERMVCREVMTCGDTGAIKVKGGLVQLVESEQIYNGSKGTVDGIDTDSVGKPTMFHVRPYKNGRVNESEDGELKLTPDEFLYIADPDRPSSTRCEPPCQSSFSMFHRLNDICDSEAIAWQVLSRMAIAITRENAPDLAYSESGEDETVSPEDYAQTLARRVVNMAGGIIFHGQPGEKVEGIARNIPSSNFTESCKMFLRMMGLPLGLPLEIMLLDWTQSNYSQSRAVLEQAFQTFTAYQELIEDYFLRPIFEWKMAEWVAAGLYPREMLIVDHDWIKPSFPWIDQLKEAQASGEKIDRGITTHTQVCKELNADRDELMDKRQAEIEDAIRRAKEIEAKTKEKVDWKLFAGLSMKDAQPKPAEPEKGKPEQAAGKPKAQPEDNNDAE